MPASVVVITPEVTPGAGGLADYTLRVVGQWTGIDVRFVLPKQDLAGGAPNAEMVERNAEALRAKLPASSGKVLLQYSAYGFDHYGYPRWLLRALLDWKEATTGRLVVMFHEIWTFWPVLNKNYLIQQLHRRDLRKLVAVADAVFTSTASQAEHLRNLSPGSTVEVLPVGSNVAPSREQTGPRDRGLAVVFGLQGTRIKALEMMKEELAALVAAERITKVVTVGAGDDPEAARKEARLLGENSEQRGARTEAEISELLSHAAFGISAQDELSITKSGTFMAYAAHGLNILSLFAGAARAEPLCWATHPAELRDGIAEDELQTRADNLRAWQERTCSSPHIAERFAQALHLCRHAPAGRAALTPLETFAPHAPQGRGDKAEESG